MIDIVQLLIKAGKGGDGWVSFRREKFVTKGGPDGGDGGDGGSIIIRATKNHATLAHFAGIKEVVAANGKNGAKKKMIGRSAEDEVIEVPLGTVVWQVAARHLYKGNQKRKYYLEEEKDPIPARTDLEDQIEVTHLNPHHFSKVAKGPEKQLLTRLITEGQEFVICRGGRGGRGNTAFKSSKKTTPLEAEYGTLGQERLVVLELELLADVGLVGLPNAGKSTFLSRVTKAQPKIANYPFTTLEPNLGVWQLSESSESHVGPSTVVVADIPGLIEGASQGKGLGHEFLRHVKNCQVLVFVLYLPEEVVFDSSVSDTEKVQQLWEQYVLLEKELEAYNQVLIGKPRIITVNKADLYSDELQNTISTYFQSQLKKQTKEEETTKIMMISGATGQNISALATEVRRIFS